MTEAGDGVDLMQLHAKRSDRLVHAALQAGMMHDMGRMLRSIRRSARIVGTAEKGERPPRDRVQNEAFGFNSLRGLVDARGNMHLEASPARCPRHRKAIEQKREVLVGKIKTPSRMVSRAGDLAQRIRHVGKSGTNCRIGLEESTLLRHFGRGWPCRVASTELPGYNKQ